MVSRECLTDPREASGLAPEAVHGHVAILLATALAGYSVARGRYLLALLLVPFPAVYLYKRYEKARTYRVQSDTPV